MVILKNNKIIAKGSAAINILEFDEGGDSIVTHNLKMLKELILS